MKQLLTTLSILAFLGFASFAFAEVPAAYKKCIACHGVDGKKPAPGSDGKIIAGHSKAELLTLLKNYKAKTGGGKGKAIMYGQMANVSDTDIEILADYISKLPK